MRFHVAGYTDRDEQLREIGNVTVTGRYTQRDLRAALADVGASLAWFPAVWPETFSYTLSEALAAGLMPVAFDFGAIAERIRAIGWGRLLPPTLMFDPQAIADALASVEIEPPPPRLATGAAYADILRDYYETPERAGERERLAG